MSHENFEQEFETVEHDANVSNLYRLDDSYDSAVPQQRIAAQNIKANQKQFSAGDGMTTSGG